MIRSTDLQNRGVVSQAADGERYVSVPALAEYWGVHPNTVYRDIRKRALPAVRLPGGQFRVRWLDARGYGRPVE